MAGVLLLSRSIRPCESMPGNARMFSEQVVASIICDSHCGMTDVAFRTALPNGGPSCLIEQGSLFILLSDWGLRALSPTNGGLVVVVVVQSSSESVIKKVTLLGEMHLRGLRQKMMLLQLTEESAKKLEVCIVNVTRCFSVLP